jgi:uncharacterized protein
MGRLLVLVVLVVLAVWLIRRALRRIDQKNPPAMKPGELVACAQCGVLLPRSEARMQQGALYCSEEHARLGKR